MTVALAKCAIEDASALQGLAAEWDALWRRCPDATPFQSPSWLLPWWRSFAPGELATVAVRRGRRLVALAPLYRDPTAGSLLPLGVSVSDFHDVLIDPDEPAAGPALAVAMLSAAGPDGRIVWPDVPPGAALQHLFWRGGEAEWHVGETAPELACAAGLESVPAAQRRKLRMARHRAERRGGAAVVEATRLGLDAWLEALFRLHGARWRSKGGAGVLADDAVRAFHRQAAPALSETGLLDATALTIGGRLAGVYYGLRHGATAYAYLSGFDPEFERESPGTLLLGDAIERAAAAGCARFSLLRGAEDYKFRWGAADRHGHTLVVTAGRDAP
ncbi:GNAT family N-acetyltransferase [Alsobacter sp. SYSU M60028]|uniref:GNAT family N-acetyltransferase n=1 Tax=Alsobacter ponti TaxID=2962936 RepID=A0ABT1LBR5_9HYPH|nr:GNAT family N-acetyltransferase [Alsobacter ponti]MCP8938927.1 GNAT family N-acetyltransferase [Alsobacter ponti]